jgi:hypothetical protein
MRKRIGHSPRTTGKGARRPLAGKLNQPGDAAHEL